jgi:hypothetical protein
MLDWGEEPSSSCQIGGKGARWSNNGGQGDGAGSMQAIVSRVEVMVQGNLMDFLSIVIEEVQGQQEDRWWEAVARAPPQPRVTGGR